VDLGPNLGSINRAALIAADYVVIPWPPDLFSLQGLRNLGPAFEKWRREWKDRLDRKPPMDIELPSGRMQPIGYIVHPAQRPRGSPREGLRKMDQSNTRRLPEIRAVRDLAGPVLDSRRPPQNWQC